MLEPTASEQQKTQPVFASQKGEYRGLFYALFRGGSNYKLPSARLTPGQKETIARVEEINPQEANRLRQIFERHTTEVSVASPILEVLGVVAELAYSMKERICTFQIPLYGRRADERKIHERD